MISRKFPGQPEKELEQLIVALQVALKPSVIGAQLHPVGSLYFQAYTPTNPATLLGYGVWSAYATGRVLVGVDTSQTAFDAIGETGGATTATLGAGADIGAGAAFSSTAANLPPYITVYIWVRTA